MPAPSRTRGLAGVALMATVMLLSVALMALYRGDVVYFFSQPVAQELGEADQLRAGDLEPDQYVTIRGMPLAGRAIRFRRFAHAGLFRIYPIAGQPKIFVERFTPEGTAPGRAALHGEYTGRILRFSQAGSGYQSVRHYLEQQMGTPVPDDAWLLIDGEKPRDRYWTLAIYAMLGWFFAFNAFFLYRHSRAIRD